VRVFTVFAVLLLVSMPAFASNWCWDDVGDTADGYRFYWGYTGAVWLSVNRVEVDRFFACADNECCVAFDEASIPDDLIFFTVTSFNQYGESPTEHGLVEVLP